MPPTYTTGAPSDVDQRAEVLEALCNEALIDADLQSMAETFAPLTDLELAGTVYSAMQPVGYALLVNDPKREAFVKLAIAHAIAGVLKKRREAP